MNTLETSTTLWIAFNFFVVFMLALDLGVFHRKAHEVSFKEAITWSFVWVILALIFNLGIYHFRGPEQGLQFFTGYVIEKALSVDNIFVFLMIFTYFKVPLRYQHKVLFWGVLGALVMRALFIFLGIALIEKFHWTIYLFGAFLIFTGIKMALPKKEEIALEKSIVIRLAKKIIPVTHDDHGGKFFVRLKGKLWATPLFIVLIMVEVTDLIFAVDSIPAILAITDDAFIVYTSNVFAILGLRSLYFALAGFAKIFVYLQYGLAAVLVFVGVKMTLVDFYKIPISVSLTVIASLLVISIVASMLRARREKLR